MKLDYQYHNLYYMLLQSKIFYFQGDSGGPLQFSNNVGGRRRPTIVGITSFGQYCAGPSPGIYTRVSAYLNWIEPILLSDL